MCTPKSSVSHSFLYKSFGFTSNSISVSSTPMADLTPPAVRLLSFPPAPSKDTQWRFRFTCLNEWRCTYVCSVHIDGAEPRYTTCPGSFLASGLQSGSNYEFTVIATDGVGNIGSETIYQWEVGKLL